MLCLLSKLAPGCCLNKERKLFDYTVSYGFVILSISLLSACLIGEKILLGLSGKLIIYMKLMLLF